jgi:predicted Rossmann fold flavoprotein
MNYKFDVTVNFLPGKHETGVLDEFRTWRASDGAKTLSAHNPFGLPSRLWSYLLDSCGISADLRWNTITNDKVVRLAQALCGQVFHADGKTTFKEEFVTAGGVSLKEVDPHRFQSRKVPGLYFAGEVLDIDGITGGFNFQNAWTGGWLVARSVAGVGEG